jgi:hypothetical protein
MSLDALHLFHKTAPRLSLDDCDAVLEALAALGYRLETGDATSRPVVGNGEWVNLAKDITRIAPIGHNDALEAFSAITHLGYKIRHTKKAA